MRNTSLPIASPCHESWDAMNGDEARRFCGICQKDVHNLSAMAHAEAQALLREKSGEHLCVRYSSESDGTLRFRDLVPRASLTRRVVRAAFAASMLAACTPHGDPTDLGREVIEAIREATVPTADGGCDYTTGPFTTFHLPPGHVLCRADGPQAIEQRIIEAIQPLPPPIPMMGAPMPIEPPPPLVVDPVERPKMGELMAVPEPGEPLVPCDPKPGFAAPPPGVEPSHVRMGDVAAEPPRPAKPPKARKAQKDHVLMGDTYELEPESTRELMGKIAAPVD